jgi:hypothetical protein
MPFSADRRSMGSLQLRSQDENNIVRISLMESVCGILVTDNVMGAQTKRSGAAEAGEYFA